MHLLSARDEAVACLLCGSVEEFTAELPLTDEAMEFFAWKEHGCRLTESLMTGFVPGDLKRLFTVVRAASSRGSAKAKLFMEDMIQIGEDVHAQRNHRLTQIMQLPMQNQRRAVYAFLWGDTPFCPPAGRVWQQPPWNPYDGLPGNLQATFQRARLHGLLLFRSYITYQEAMFTFFHWIAAVAQAFSQCIECRVVQDYLAFREWSRMVSALSCATVRAAKVQSPDGRSEPWLQLVIDYQAVGSVMGWPREVVPGLQQPLCNLPVLAVATMLVVGAMSLYDRRLWRVISATSGQRSIAVLVGSRQLARNQGDNAQGQVTEVLLSLLEVHDNVPAHARRALDALGLGAVVEARSGKQRMVIASARGPRLAGVDVIAEMVQDCRWKLVMISAQSLRPVRWPRLLESLSATLSGQPMHSSVST